MAENQKPSINPIDSDDICPTTAGRHRPDFNSVSLCHDGETVYLDINCADCGRSGCIGEVHALIDNIMW